MIIEYPEDFNEAKGGWDKSLIQRFANELLKENQPFNSHSTGKFKVEHCGSEIVVWEKVRTFALPEDKAFEASSISSRYEVTSETMSEILKAMKLWAKATQYDKGAWEITEDK